MPLDYATGLRLSRRARALPFALALALVLPAALPLGAAEVDERFVFEEMNFVTDVAEEGYFNLARYARDEVKAMPGLTQEQRAFLDLVRAEINTQELLEENDLDARSRQLDEAIAYLDKVTDSLPAGSKLRIVARGRVVTTYITVAEGYLKEIDRLRMDIDGGVGDVEALKDRRERLRQMALEVCNRAGSLARPVQDEYKEVFYNILDLVAETYDNAALKARYLKLLTTIFMQQVRYERRVAGLYVTHARLHPRGSSQRDTLFQDGYWFTMDIDEMHSEYLEANYFTAMNMIRLAGLKDQPLPKKDPEGGQPKAVKTLIHEIDPPVELMTRYFVEDVVQEEEGNKGRAVRVAQEDRPKCLFFFAQSWLRLARGAYARADAAGAAGDAEERARAEAYRQQAARMVGACQKAVAEIEKAEDSIVGPVPEWLQKKTILEIRVPLRILLAERARTRKEKQGALESLAAARTACEELILSPDQTWAEEAKKHLVVVDAMADRWGLDLGESAGAVIAEADRIYSRYIDLKNRPPRDRSEIPAWRERCNDLLRDMRTAYIKAIRLIQEHGSLSKRIKADYTAKAWYQSGYASLNLEEYYQSFVANQFVLQAFPVEKYDAETFPGVERFRKYASKNIVASASRQRKRTRKLTGDIVPFDGKLYAWSLIWRIRYETAVGKREAKIAGKEAEGLKGGVKDYFWPVAKEFERIKRYDDAYEWFARAPEESRLYRLSFLMRGQVALKQAQRDWREAKILTRQLQRLETTDPERYEEVLRQRNEAQEAGDTWARRSLADANHYIAAVRKTQEEYPRLTDLPPEMRHLRDMMRQERNALYGAILLIMQSRFNAAEAFSREEKLARRKAEAAEEEGRDPAPHLAAAREAAAKKKPIYAEVRDLWPAFEGVEIRTDDAEEIRMKAAYMQLVALLESVDFEEDAVDVLHARLVEAEPLSALIDKQADALREADPDARADPIAIRAPLYLGQKWMTLARRVRESAPDKYEEYRLAAGEKFGGAITVVEQSLKFGLMVGDIFTDMELYDKAEEVYELALEHWDTPERREDNTLPARKTAADMVRKAYIFYSRHGGADFANEMKALFVELAEQGAPQTGKPDFYQARRTVAEIRELHDRIRDDNPGDPLLANPENSPELQAMQTYLEDMDSALDYHSDMERVKSGLVLAKVDMGKWDEALALLEDLLAEDEWNKTYRLLRGEVHVARAEAAEAWGPEVKKDMEIAMEVSRSLTSRPRDDKLAYRSAGKGSPVWWDAIALNYRARAVEYLLKQDRPDQPVSDKEGAKTIAEEAARTMKHIRMFQTGPQYEPTQDFKQATDEVYDALADAGYVEMGLTPERIAELQAQAEAREATAERARANREKKARNKRRDKIRMIQAKEKPAEAAREFFRTFPDQEPVYREEYPELMTRWLGPPPKVGAGEAEDGAGAEDGAAGEDAAETPPDEADGAAEGEDAAGEADAPGEAPETPPAEATAPDAEGDAPETTETPDAGGTE